jgi:hypothetical protein
MQCLSGPGCAAQRDFDEEAGAAVDHHFLPDHAVARERRAQRQRYPGHMPEGEMSVGEGQKGHGGIVGAQTPPTLCDEEV